ncbi:MAG: M28 family peptidase, partial [Candidatus Brocadiia bacterium]
IIVFRARTVKVLSIIDSEKKAPIAFSEIDCPGDDFLKCITFYFPSSSPAKPTAAISYVGTINDPIKGSGALRFIVGDYTRGIICPSGIYLNGGSGWYPDTYGSMAIYSCDLTTPPSYDVVAPGNLIKRTKDEKASLSAYVSDTPSDGLDIAGGKYVITTKTVDGITIETCFSAEDAGLSGIYLDSAAEYIEKYSKLLGKYPYNRFSIVSNFFPTGYGMPAFTLLGADVIKRRHIQEYALGHEVVHNWWGNGVYVDYESGNWCEGLTTYCSNYYWLEMVGGPMSDAAKELRRKTSQRYKITVKPEDDYPPIEFRGKTVEADNEIGYTKVSMFFHQLRLKIGTDEFFNALRRFYKENLGKRAGWNTLRAAFEAESGQQLTQFFAMWLSRPGLPKLGLEGVKYESREGKGKVVWTLTQPEPLSDVMVEVVVTLKSEQHRQMVRFDSAKAEYSMILPEEPQMLEVDPDFNLLRDLYDGEVKPCLNKTLYFDKPIVVPAAGGDTQERFNTLADRIAKSCSGEIMKPDALTQTTLKDKSAMVIGKVSDVEPLIGADTFQISPFEMVKRKLAAVKGFDGSFDDIAFLISLDSVGKGTTTFYCWFGQAPPDMLDRIMFFYGQQGYAVFKSGRKIDEGSIPARGGPLTFIFSFKGVQAPGKVNLTEGMTESAARAILDFLTSPELAGRAAGTEGGQKAAEFLAGLLEKAGVKPALAGGYLQKFSFPVRGIRECSVSWPEAKAGALAIPAYSGKWNEGAEICIPAVYGADGQCTRPAVFAGFGIDSAKLGRNDFAALAKDELRGKIAIISADLPPDVAALDDAQKYELRAEYSLYRRAKNAADKGASAVVFVNIGASMERELPDYTFTNLISPAFQARYFSGDPGKTPADDRLMAANLQARYREFGDQLTIPVILVPGAFDFGTQPVALGKDFQVSLRVEYADQMIDTQNIVGRIEGSDPTQAMSAVILCAHYDGMGLTKNGSLLPSANDNISGVVALLGAACDLAKSRPKNSVIILFAGAEEWGLRGAGAYCANPAIPLSRTVAFLNLDMVGRVEKEKYYVIGAGQNPDLGVAVAAAAAKLKLDVEQAMNHAIMGSDQWLFHLRGIPAILLTTGRYAEMNSAGDTAEKITWKSLLDASQLWAELTRALDSIKLTPPADRFYPTPVRKR